MLSLLNLIDTVIGLYVTVLIASVIMSWLVAFDVVNTSNRFVYLIGDALHRLTEPLLGRIRRIIPAAGGIDLSPLVLILGLYLIRNLLFEYAGGPRFN